MCSSIVEEGLSYRFHASWPFVLQILGCFYQIAGKQAHPIMVKVKLVLMDTVSFPCRATEVIAEVFFFFFSYFN